MTFAKILTALLLSIGSHFFFLDELKNRFSLTTIILFDIADFGTFLLSSIALFSIIKTFVHYDNKKLYKRSVLTDEPSGIMMLALSFSTLLLGPFYIYLKFLFLRYNPTDCPDIAVFPIMIAFTAFAIWFIVNIVFGLVNIISWLLQKIIPEKDIASINEKEPSFEVPQILSSVKINKEEIRTIEKGDFKNEIKHLETLLEKLNNYEIDFEEKHKLNNQIKHLHKAISLYEELDNERKIIAKNNILKGILLIERKIEKIKNSNNDDILMEIEKSILLIEKQK